MSSIDIQAVTAPTPLPQTDSRRPASSKSVSRPSVAGWVARIVLAGIVLACAAAIVPVAAIYSFIWLAHI